MGKSIKGKELGSAIYQRPNGTYEARYIHLKYRYPVKAKKNGALYVSCSEPCIHVTVSGIDGIYSNAYMIIGVEGVYKGKSVIRITDEEGKVIGELPVRVTNNPYRAKE